MINVVKWLIITGLAAGFAVVAQAEEFDIGKSEFQSSCASCHGTDAKGKGPVSDQLKISPPDLTMLAKSNNGVFPATAVYETINGLKTIPAHGTREMPIWGFDVMVRNRITAIVDYLSRIQEK